jgi:hypothetical protein
MPTFAFIAPTILNILMDSQPKSEDRWVDSQGTKEVYTIFLSTAENSEVGFAAAVADPLERPRACRQTGHFSA